MNFYIALVMGEAFIPNGLQLLFPVSPVQLGLALGDDPLPWEGGYSVQFILGPFLLGKVVPFIEFSFTCDSWVRLFIMALLSSSCSFHPKFWTGLSIRGFLLITLLGNVLIHRGKCLGAFWFHTACCYWG